MAIFRYLKGKGFSPGPSLVLGPGPGYSPFFVAGRGGGKEGEKARGGGRDGGPLRRLGVGNPCCILFRASGWTYSSSVPQTILRYSSGIS